MARPKDAKYSETHEWLRQYRDIWRLGITDHAVHELSDLVSLDLPKPGASFAAGDTLGEIESVKAVSELYAPADLKVIEVNKEAIEDLDVLGRDPFGDGWLLEVELTNPEQLEDLLNRQAYDEHVAED